MKIDYAVVSSDDNPTYLDFWPIVRKLWERIGVEPVLLYFGNKKVKSLGGKVIKFDSTEYDYIATCWARYWYMSQQTYATGILSDIDMLPFSKWYFIDQLKDIQQWSYVHLNPCIETYSRLPSCYHVANGAMIRHNLGDVMHYDFNESLNMLLSKSFDNSTCYVDPKMKHWCYDEYYATEQLMKNERQLTLIKRPGGESGHRIDRTNWVYDEDLLAQGHYYDAHSIRPYQENKQEIDKIVNIVLNS